MDIAAVSAGVSMGKTQQAAGFSTVRKAMDTAEVQAANLLEMMEQAVPASFGHRLDIRA